MGAIFSGIVGGWIADRWGRKCSLMFTGVPYMTGYLILSYAHYSTNATVFKILLFGGRFMTGVAMGSSSVVVAVSDRVTGIMSTASYYAVFVHWRWVIHWKKLKFPAKTGQGKFPVHFPTPVLEKCWKSAGKCTLNYALSFLRKHDKSSERVQEY